MLITKELLKKHRACKNQINKFDKLFPNGVDATRELCLAHAQTFDFIWARRLLSPPARKAYNEAPAPAREAYDEAIAPAWKAYDEALAPARKARDEAIAPAWKAYDEATAPAYKAFDEAIAPAYKARDEAIAAAWFDASQKE